MSTDIGDKHSVLFQGLSGFWQRFFKDQKDLEAYYQASEVYLGQVYLDFLSAILNIGVIDTPVFNKESWKLFIISETDTKFVAGGTAADNRFVYDMPGDIVFAEILQNTIFAPTVTVEKDVGFDLFEDDGLIRFLNDPFRMEQNGDGVWISTPGVATRTVTRAVGNQLSDRHGEYFSGNDPYGNGVQRGDTLRLLAQTKDEKIASGTLGVISFTGSEYTFNGVGIGSACKSGDIINVFGHAGASGDPNDVFKGFYIVKAVDDPNNVTLESNTLGFPFTSSTQPLYWEAHHALYFEVSNTSPFKDYEVDYIDGKYCVGSADNPYPVDTSAPLIYSVVRDAPDPNVSGVPTTFLSWDGTSPRPAYPVLPPGSSIGATYLNIRHIIPGSVRVAARTMRYDSVTGMWDECDVTEGIDYSVDYLNGIIRQTTYWIDTSNGNCSFQYMTEVLVSAGGDISTRATGNIKQLTYWVPEVLVDRFTLYYNYGTLLNRFEASSEQYKAFLRGIMYLYMSGPILERMEAALNLAAEFPVVRTDREVLQGYADGITARGTTGVLNATTEALTVDTGDHIFSTEDEGATIVFNDPINATNKGEFTIRSIDTTTNTVYLDTYYGFTTENPISWQLSRTNQQVVTTNRQDYFFPLYVPIREDVMDPNNFGELTFEIFEALTLAFRVTDYLEDPHWWHGKYIPYALWDAPSRQRRLISTLLYENVIDADDQPEIGDPGFFIGADDEGNVFTPNDNDPLSPQSVPLYRHNAAFILFDRYLKMQMFYIEIDRGLPLSREFRDDLTNLILVVKPSYTMPYVEPGELFIDNVILTDEFTIANITFLFGGAEDDGSDAVHLASNELVIGDSNFPWHIGDFFRYQTAVDELVPGAPNPVTVGYAFTVPSVPVDAGLITLNVNATIGGNPVLEGRDYTVNWLLDSPNAWRVVALTDWDSGTLTVTYRYTDRLSGAYDTRQGWTPLIINGTNPWYVRKGALDPDSLDYLFEMSTVRTEQVDRPVQLTINVETAPGSGVYVSYVYP
jgi:hypothetical protein